MQTGASVIAEASAGFAPHVASRRRGRRRRAVLPIGLVIVVFAACVGDDTGHYGVVVGGSRSSTSSATDDTAQASLDEKGDPATELPSTTAAEPEPDPPSTTTAVDPPGMISVRELDVPQFMGQGTQGSFAGMERVGPFGYAFGFAQDVDDGIRRPFLLRQWHGGRWNRVSIEMPSDADEAMASDAAASPEGGMVIAGSKWSGGAASVVVWTSYGAGYWRSHPIGDELAGSGPQTIDEVASGGAGMAMTVTNDGNHEVWTSDAGETWSRASIPGDPEDLELETVAVNDEGFLVTATRGERRLVLTSSDGTSFEVVHRLDADEVEFQDAISFGDGYAIGGGRIVDGQYAPRVWRTDGLEWPDRGDALPPRRATSTLGHQAEVVVADDGRLMALVDGALAVSSTPGEWEYAIDYGPGGSLDVRAMIAGYGDSVAEVLVGDREIWLAASAGWSRVTEVALPSSDRRVELRGVAHHDGSWVAAGRVHSEDQEPRSVIWESRNGREWRSAGSLPGGLDHRVSAVGRSNDGFVIAATDVHSGGVDLWTSHRGQRWSPLEGRGLDPPQLGGLQPESIVATPTGFAMTGFRFDPTGIDPWLVTSHEGELSAAQLPAVEGFRDTVTLGVCGGADGLVVVGGVQEPEDRPTWWTRTDQSAWDHEILAERQGMLLACMFANSHVLAAGRGARIGDRSNLDVYGISGDRPGTPIAQLPGSAHAGVFEMLQLPDRLVAVGVSDVYDVDGHDVYDVDGHDVYDVDGHDVIVWVSDDLTGEQWTKVESPVFGGAGEQMVVDVATDGDRAIVIMSDDEVPRAIEVTPT